jgi:hypothetical protein
MLGSVEFLGFVEFRQKVIEDGSVEFLKKEMARNSPSAI